MRPGGAGDGDVPDFVAERDRVVDEVVTFARALRAHGVDVPTNAGVDATRALVELGFDDRDRVRIGLRSVLVTRKEDLPTFDRLFPEFWRRLTGDRDQGTAIGQPGADPPTGGMPLLDEPAPDPGDQATPEDSEGEGDRDGFEVVEARIAPTEEGSDGDDADGDEDALTATYSPSGSSEPVTLHPGLFGQGDRLDAAVSDLTEGLAALRGRRWHRAGDERVDARRALRQSFGTGGAVIAVPERARKRSAVRAVLLVDVSQSVLDTIDRAFLVRFLRRAVRAWRSVRIFFFDTSVREVTDAFDAPSAREAVAALEAAETAWGGGTRIGNAIDTVRREYPDAVDRDAVVLVVSDGLEVGEIDLLEDGMTWLAGRAGGVLWLNPLATSPQYEPTCRGMATALPYVDGLFAFTAVADVEELARQLGRHRPGRPLGYEQDVRRLAG